MDTLELVVSIYYNDGKIKETIEYHDDVYSEDVLDDMKNELKAIEYTVETLTLLSLSNVDRIGGIIFRRRDDNSVDVLDGFSICLEQPKKQTD